MKFLTKNIKLKIVALAAVFFGFGAFSASAQNADEPEILVTEKGTEYEILGWETNAMYNPETYTFVYWDNPVMAKSTTVKNKSVPVSDFERPPVFDGVCLTKNDPSAMFECSTEKFNMYMEEQSFDYPDMAQFAKDEGIAYVTFTLDEKGEMSRIQVSMAEACKGCAEAAADIIGSTEDHWYPALRNGGKAVKTKLTVPVKFKFKDQ